jgi:uncharacterized cupredoxin-like copper-binding protein
MPLPIRCLVAAAIVVAAVSARSETAPGPYAGQQARPVKALSESEMNGLLDGSGAGFAKADQLFSQKQANPPALDRATQRVGLLQAQLRAEHLKTHLSQTALLGPEQVRRCAVLRGYASDTGGVAPMDPVTPSHHHHSHDHSHAASIGVPGKAAKVSRSVNVDMTDTMRFNPASIDVKQGETIRFVVKNSGQLKHEFVLGTDKELKAHYELMKKFPEMEHSDPNQVTVAPGKAGEVIWQFTKAGKVDFACLQPGHYDAGMKGIVNVAAGKGAAKNADSHGDHKD